MMAGLWDHSQGGIMPSSSAPWSPSEGDPVRLKDSGLVGTVIQTKGVYEARFRVKVPPPTAGDDAAALKRARAAARRASRWYGLDELDSPS
jgi:hypothetical protein